MLQAHMKVLDVVCGVHPQFVTKTRRMKKATVILRVAGWMSWKTMVIECVEVFGLWCLEGIKVPGIYNKAPITIWRYENSI